MNPSLPSLGSLPSPLISTFSLLTRDLVTQNPPKASSNLHWDSPWEGRAEWEKMALAEPLGKAVFLL